MTTSSSVHGSENGNIADLLCTLVREQAAPQVTIESFDGNPLNFAYFLLMFTESVEKKIEDLNGKIDQADQMHHWGGTGIGKTLHQ